MLDRNLRAVQQILPNIKESRWSNKTDFYSLFVALAFVQRPLDVGSTTAKHVRSESAGSSADSSKYQGEPLEQQDRLLFSVRSARFCAKTARRRQHDGQAC